MVNVIVSSAGVQGPRGNTVLTGTGAPANTVGIDGDYYINTANYPTSAVLYGPRATGAWPATGITLGGSGGGAVTSVNSQTGAVVITAAGLGALLAANNLSDLANAVTARTNLGLGTAATQASTAFDAAGAAATAQTTAEAYTDTQISGEVTRANGAYLAKANSLSDVASASTARTNLGLSTLVTAKANLTATTNPTTGSDGTQGYSVGSVWVNTASSVEYVCTNAATGAAVWTPILAVGTTAGTVAAGNDARFVTAATTVVTETGYGQASAVGAATTYAREDHTHGSPALTSSAPATTEGIGQAGAVGTATTPARADHVHPLAAAGAPAASAVTSTQTTGVATTFAASDHVHAREGFGAVTAQTSFGAASATGSAATVAHSDHAHGTPALPAATASVSGTVQLAGDLGGTAAAPSVLKVNGVTISGTPAAGNVPIATGSTAAAWTPIGVPLKSTWWYPADGGGGNRTMTFNLLWIYPFDCQRAITISKLACNVTTAGTAGSTIRLGIYSSDGAGSIGNLLLDAGTVAGDATGVKQITGLTTAAGPDRLWLCAVWQGTNTSAPVLQAYSKPLPYVGWTSFVQFPPMIGYQYAGITGALPATLPTPTANENNNAPAVQFSPA